MNEKKYGTGYCPRCLKGEEDCTCMQDDVKIHLDSLIKVKSDHPTSLTCNQKLNALAYRFYQGGKWIPKSGDFYTTSRADLELYKVVDVTDNKIMTKYCIGSDVISEWDKGTFLTKGFGINRVYVPDFIFDLK